MFDASYFLRYVLNIEKESYLEIKSYLSSFVHESKSSNDVLKIVKSLNRGTIVLLSGEKGFIAQMINENISNDLFSHIIYGFDSDNDEKNILLELKEKINKNKFVTLYLENMDFCDNQTEMLQLIENKNAKSTSISSICTEDNEYASFENKIDKNLSYLLSSLVININPLRNRKEDIFPLCEYYINKISSWRKIPVSAVSDMAKKVLVDNFWENNIDELINTLDRCVIFCKNKRISCDMIKLGSLFLSEIDEEDKTLKSSLDAFKKKYVKAILEENNWNQTKTAKILGIQRTYVIKLINELNIRK